MRKGQVSRPHGRNYSTNPNRNRQQIPGRNQSFDSNGPNVKIRGTPHQIFERYTALGREASTSGDWVAAENLYQHAEHYFRVTNAANGGHQNPTMPRTAPEGLQPETSEEEGSKIVGPAYDEPNTSLDANPQTDCEPLT
jgi:hypothetical protein